MEESSGNDGAKAEAVAGGRPPSSTGQMQIEESTSNDLEAYAHMPIRGCRVQRLQEPKINKTDDDGGCGGSGSSNEWPGGSLLAQDGRAG
eukprot:CAMPEP_0206557110 /NCGR_PEP_ID=MMETSP0325_2-20121206/18879_1 /ASSEMBLY_ACC=CAM_ASM_000347 /TAXON_ID=2866 /ORGANISM="Crypthecodinium cohnii, Strain Seligo" /LENGTH=89 /DNA_ID=CAMNT_0054057909 /DNA_START=179 /DNA_END=448 /DNA_ORIENTATION=-